MEILRFDLEKRGGKFKIMNAVNNGPSHKRHAVNQPIKNILNCSYEDLLEGKF